LDDIKALALRGALDQGDVKAKFSLPGLLNIVLIDDA
tara:strand:- start:2041 stop:2151 length:111 start_codon:yes stop_codon:yes gene_type:complete